MDRMSKLILIGVGSALGVIILLSVFVELVPIRTYGVRQEIWASGGVDEHDFATGYHFGITGVHKWHFLDSCVHFLEFTESATSHTPGAGSRGFFPKSGGVGDHETPVYQYAPALEIRNRDGNVVTVDVSVPYRIVKGAANEIVRSGAMLNYKDRVKTTVESVLREALSDMSNEAFQDTEKRLQAQTRALETLNGDERKGIRRFHVEALNVLIRRMAFPAEYENKLQQKQLFTQKALLDQAETLKLQEVLRTGTIDKEIAAAEAQSSADWEKKNETVRQETAIQVATIQAEAIQYSKRTRAEGDAIYQTKLAEGKLALDRAEALLSQLRSEALSTTGGKIFIARLAADSINMPQVTLNASDPRVPMVLDLHRMADLLLGEDSENAPQSAASTPEK